MREYNGKSNVVIMDYMSLLTKQRQTGKLADYKKYYDMYKDVLEGSGSYFEDLRIKEKIERRDNIIDDLLNE